MTRETELSKTSIDLCFANFECKLPVDKKKTDSSDHYSVWLQSEELKILVLKTCEELSRKSRFPRKFANRVL